VLKRQSREVHAKVAKWLAEWTARGGLRAGDFLGAAAEHFERAGDEVNAAEFHARAAYLAGQRFAHDRVLAHVGRALGLLGKLSTATLPGHAELRWRLLWVREKTLDLQARRNEQAADLEALAHLADVLDDDRRRAQVAWRSSFRAMRMADWKATEDSARHGLACAARIGDDSLRLHALRLLAIARMEQGDIEGGQALAQQGLADARTLALPGIEARMLNVLSVAAKTRRDFLGSLDLYRQGLQIHRETGDRINEAIALSNLGVAWLGLGDLARARRDLEEALQLLRANGDRITEGATLANLSRIALYQGDETLALSLARSALDIALAGQARDNEVTAGLRLGEAELALGRLAESRQAYMQARTRMLDVHSAPSHAASAGLTRVALAEGDVAAAWGTLQSLVDRVSSGGKLDQVFDPEFEFICYQVLSRVGDVRASDCLVRAHAALMVKADAILNAAIRTCFLQNTPHHRDIVAAWSRRDVPGAAPTKTSG
jgi:tetratricopeptide (TPR) repeat protein